MKIVRNVAKPNCCLSLQALERMEREKDMRILRYQYVPSSDTVETIKEIVEKNNYDIPLAFISVFNYGVICGKRQERIRKHIAKRKATAINLTGSKPITGGVG